MLELCQRWPDASTVRHPAWVESRSAASFATSAEDLIKIYGWSELVAIWGNQLITVAVGYTFTYLALILGVVLSVAASDLLQPRKEE